MSAKIITLPDERLKLKSARVDVITPRVLEVALSLSGLLDEIPHAVGIAAPQIAEQFAGRLRIIAVDARKAKRLCVNRGRLILINPEIISSSGRMLSREGCMSVPGFQGMVERASDIKIKALVPDPRLITRIGAHKSLSAMSPDDTVSGCKKFMPAIFRSSGFEAVVLQHEIDHLDGILFIDKIKRW